MILIDDDKAQTPLSIIICLINVLYQKEIIKSSQIKNYLFTHANKLIVYIRAKCSKVFTHIQTQLL